MITFESLYLTRNAFFFKLHMVDALLMPISLIMIAWRQRVSKIGQKVLSVMNMVNIIPSIDVELKGVQQSSKQKEPLGFFVTQQGNRRSVYRSGIHMQQSLKQKNAIEFFVTQQGIE